MINEIFIFYRVYNSQSFVGKDVEGVMVFWR